MKVYVGYIEGYEGAIAVYMSTQKKEVEKAVEDLCIANGISTKEGWVKGYNLSMGLIDLDGYC